MVRRRARSGDPWTSHAAIPSEKEITKLQLKALRVFETASRPMNGYEVGDYAGHDGLWKRMNELLDDGHINHVGENMSPRSTRDCQTYVISPRGREYLIFMDKGKERK